MSLYGAVLTEEQSCPSTHLQGVPLLPRHSQLLLLVCQLPPLHAELTLEGGSLLLQSLDALLSAFLLRQLRQNWLYTCAMARASLGHVAGWL